MANGEGAYWEGDVDNKDGVTYEVEVTSSPVTGSVRIEIAKNDTPLSIARNLAAEWNARQPIEDVVAVADETEPLTSFFLTGQWEEEDHHITMMAATFDGRPRVTMPDLGDSVASLKNDGPPPLKVTRVDVGCRVIMKEAFMSRDQVEVPARKMQPLPTEPVA